MGEMGAANSTEEMEDFVVTDTSSGEIDDSLWLERDRKVSESVRQELELRAQTGIPMRHFQLAYFDLEHIDLVNRFGTDGYELTDSDLYRANLSGAHCFKLNLSGSSLMKADLSGANLNCANLRGCNLLGTNFKRAKIEHVEWGNKLLQEELAESKSDAKEKIKLYQEAEEIYRNLRKTTEQQGLFETAGHFFQKEMLARRKQFPKLSAKRIISKLVDLFCGYGEQPIRVILFSLIVVCFYSLAYFFSGISYQGEEVALSLSASAMENVYAFFSCLYFSVVTFTTLGYGDLAPVGLSRLFAASEAFIGSFTLALFVVVFVKKMTR